MVCTCTAHADNATPTGFWMDGYAPHTTESLPGEATHHACTILLITMLPRPHATISMIYHEFFSQIDQLQLVCACLVMATAENRGNTFFYS